MLLKKNSKAISWSNTDWKYHGKNIYIQKIVQLQGFDFIISRDI